LDDAGVIRDLEALFRREHAGILRMCRSLVGNEHDAEEATQEAFARVLHRVDDLVGEPGAYLNVVARRVCWELLRASGRTLPLEWSTTVAQVGPEEATIHRHSVAHSWSQLSHVDRQLIVGSFAGYSYAELAVRVGIPAKTVSVRLHRARKRARLSGEGLALVLPRLGAKLHARLWQPGVGEGLVTSSRCVALSAAVGLLLISVPAPVLGHASSGFPSRASASSATLPLGAGHAPGAVTSGPAGSGQAAGTSRPRARGGAAATPAPRVLPGSAGALPEPTAPPSMPDPTTSRAVVTLDVVVASQYDTHVTVSGGGQ